MPVFTSAGTKIYASASLPATEDSAGYAALTWTQIGQNSAIGDFGPAYSVIEFTPLGDRVVQKAKGSVNNGSTTIDCGRDSADAGQLLMNAAVAADCPYSFKVLHNDLPCSGGTSGTIQYFKGLVTGKSSTGLGGPDNIDALSYAVEITSSIIEVAAV